MLFARLSDALKGSVWCQLLAFKAGLRGLTGLRPCVRRALDVGSWGFTAPFRPLASVFQRFRQSSTLLIPQQAMVQHDVHASKLAINTRPRHVGAGGVNVGGGFERRLLI